MDACDVTNGYIALYMAIQLNTGGYMTFEEGGGVSLTLRCYPCCSGPW